MLRWPVNYANQTAIAADDDDDTGWLLGWLAAMLPRVFLWWF